MTAAQRRNASFAVTLMVTAIAALVWAPGAGAATVSRSVDGFLTWHVAFVASAGETNTVTVSDGGSNVVVSDSTASLTAGSGCSGGGTTVTCSETSVGYLSLSLGDMNDQFSTTAGYSLLITPGAGNDTVSGGSGGDTFHADPTPDGADSFSGGGGTDQLIYMTRTSDVSLTQDGVANDGDSCPGPSCEGDNAGASIEVLYGGAGDDIISANGLDNTIYACDGDDVVEGGGGSDTLRQSFPFPIAGCGTDTWDDTIRPGTGSDTVWAEGGKDTVTYSERSEAVRVANDGGAENGENCPGPSCEGDTIPTYITGLVGGTANDTIVGGSNDDVLTGGGGGDSITAGGGNDVLYGGDGADFLNGEAGVDAFFGESGDDTLYSRDDVADALSCGGSGGTADADSLDVIQSDCTIVYRDGQLVSQPPSGGGTDGGSGGGGSDPGTAPSCAKALSATQIKLKGKKRATVQLRSRSEINCQGRMTLRTAKKYRTSKRSKAKQVVLGAADYDVPANATASVNVKLAKKARKLVKRNSKIRVTVTLTLRTR